MKDPFFEEYELKVGARVAIPRLADSGKYAKELFDAVQKALADRKDMLVAVTSATFEPLKGEANERSKTGF